MGNRNRVLSFMSQFSPSNNRESQFGAAPGQTQRTRTDSYKNDGLGKDATGAPVAPGSQHPDVSSGDSPQPRAQRQRAPSRPMSMVQTYQPPLMDVNQDTLPELQPIFTFLNSHGNKLYQEGYFLKLDDQNTHGRANADRTWTECFAQLVGTVLSLWDATELDAAGQDGEVLPKFINLTDASIKMIESLPTRSNDEAPLQNVLSISTAGKNRYLLHFNSHHSLIQWTAGIRLAMFEHATLQEAYTGALIAGKGKGLNNIGSILDRAKFPTADWARVRFGAGTPWRRCWCVITPPDEKEVLKLQKQANKKKSAYDRSRPPNLKGDIKFYDTKKTKKVHPIATITDAYSAFAIYPQSKPLIDASTLVKLEGSITIHSNPPSTTEGFVFVMPEVHPAVSGFEMMLRWLFPVFDTFGLYGRPGRLIADTADPQSLMFALPKHRRYGYLEILDVSGLILEQGSSVWREAEWRRRMKDLTGKRMKALENGSRANSRYSSMRSTRNSYGPTRSRIQFDDGASVRSSPSITFNQGAQGEGASGILRNDSAPPGAGASAFEPPSSTKAHQRSVSETRDINRNQPGRNYDGGYEEAPPPPPPHVIGVSSGGSGLRYQNEMGTTPERVSSEDEQTYRTPAVQELQGLQPAAAPEPVAPPPAFAHAPGSLPVSKPYHSPELRRANSRMSTATLSQLAGAGGVAAGAYHTDGDNSRAIEDQRHHNAGHSTEENGQRGVMLDANTQEFNSNQRGLREDLTTASYNPLSFENSSPAHPTKFDSHQDDSQSPHNLPIISSSNSQSASHVNPPNQNPAPLSHNSQPSAGFAHNKVSQPHRIQTVSRKPLPARQSSIPTPASAGTESTAGSLAYSVIDQAAFDLIGHGKPGGHEVHRQNSNLSVYDDDNASTVSPDYASIRKSVDTRESADKPRAGVMRTVGNVDELQYGASQPQSQTPESLIPDIDFGPTLNYASDRPPRQQSPGPGQIYGRAASPGPGMNNFSTGSSPRQGSPQTKIGNEGRSRSPSRKNFNSEASHTRNESARTVAWQPGMSAIGGTNSPGNRLSITAEQFVQQRAVSATPMYAHQRQPSGNTYRASTPPTPPLVRNRSSELLVQHGHSRNSSADLLQQRPNSRGASVALGLSGSGDFHSKLSAREQEHLARVTGQPLISMAHNKSNSQGSGLVGAIEQRDREKQQMKQGINSQAVQHALAQRQQQAVYEQQHSDQMAGNYRSSQFGSNMSQYPQSQYPVQGQQRQQSWISPAAGVFAQGGGWTAPSPVYTTPPSHGRQSPSQYTAQQQYFPQQGPAGGQGRGNVGGYHGHGGN